MEEFKLELKHVIKEYEGIRVVDGIDMTFVPGQVYVLLGSNGAGKSTLAEMICGSIKPDTGQILFNGKSIEQDGVLAAKRLGIEMCGREHMNFPNLSVAENIALINANCTGKSVVFSRRKAVTAAREMLKQLGISIDPKRKMSTLSLAEQFLVQFISVARSGIKLLIMDEITDSLTNYETQKVYDVIKMLKKEGTSVLFITHRIEESIKIADKIIILRDGRMVDEHEKDIPEREVLRRAMLGEELKNRFPRFNTSRSDVILEVKNLSGPVIKDISFDLHSGEILGIAGLVGSGRTSLVKTILGYESFTEGEIIMDGRSIRTKKTFIKKKGFLPENRDEQGVFPQLNVITNISVKSLDRISMAGVVNQSEERYEAMSLVDRLDIRTVSPDLPAKVLSSGNKQKMLLARSIMAKTNLYIFDEPTKGVDMAGKLEIYNLMNDLAKRGAGILMVSSDFNELCGMCDNVIVIKDGEMVSEIKRDELYSSLLASLCAD